MLLGVGALRATAQGNYEIQVYGSDTVAPKSLMLELHSNFTPEGSTTDRRRNLSDEPSAARDGRDYAGAEQLVGGWVLPLYELAEWPWRAVGRRPYTAARAGSGLVALAGGGKRVDGDGVPAVAVLAGYVDVGDTADRG